MRASRNLRLRAQGVRMVERHVLGLMVDDVLPSLVRSMSNMNATLRSIEARTSGARPHPREGSSMTEAEALARRFHEAYERLAPEFGYKTRDASAVPWEFVPDANRSLMIAVAAEILDQGPVPENSGNEDDR